MKRLMLSSLLAAMTLQESRPAQATTFVIRERPMPPLIVAPRLFKQNDYFGDDAWRRAGKRRGPRKR